MTVHKLINFFLLIITWQNLPNLGTNILGERDLEFIQMNIFLNVRRDSCQKKENTLPIFLKKSFSEPWSHFQQILVMRDFKS